MASSIFQLEKNADFIKSLALRYGFMSCGIAKAERLDAEAISLEQFLSKGRHGSMDWLAENFDKRVDPTELVPGATAVISLLLNYTPHEKQPDGVPKVSKYAYGRDYHKVIKKKLKNMLSEMRDEFGDFNARGFVDSAPVMDKVWAQRAGLGWQGKHTNVIQKQSGSFFFIAEIICDLPLATDAAMTTDHCGTCTRCIDACPTQALEPYKIDATKCISYLTIELKEAIPSSFKNQMEGYAFGCDICQDVCPWNRFSLPHAEPDFSPKSEFLEMSREMWFSLDRETYELIFNGTPVRRAKFEGLERNVNFIKPS